MPKQSTMVNRPDAADILELPPGVSRVEWTPDKRFPMCGTFTLYLEDYTLGYLMRNFLLADPRVKFVGLRQPHPLTPSIELRIQTIQSNPINVFIEAARRQKTSLSHLKAKFKAAVDAHSNAATGLPTCEALPGASNTPGGTFGGASLDGAAVGTSGMPVSQN